MCSWFALSRVNERTLNFDYFCQLLSANFQDHHRARFKKKIQKYQWRHKRYFRKKIIEQQTYKNWCDASFWIFFGKRSRSWSRVLDYFPRIYFENSRIRVNDCLSTVLMGDILFRYHLTCFWQWSQKSNFENFKVLSSRFIIICCST